MAKKQQKTDPEPPKIDWFMSRGGLAGHFSPSLNYRLECRIHDWAVWRDQPGSSEQLQTGTLEQVISAAHADLEKISKDGLDKDSG